MIKSNFSGKNSNELRTGMESAKRVREQKVIALHNLKNSSHEIAEQLGIPEEEVQQIILSYLKLT